ncbi:unnamed protein product [Cylindrotheca closterium]|uniref:RING-type domain-containing protein n=1 Tax=Cylindrotheca closterium TaxID=2856 RepID=A0AAD2FTE6_9STRA|nr:unnamed protein product [Cylindrotheca closterium]
MPIAYHLTRTSPRGNNCRSIVTAFSIAVCIRIWITSSIALAQTDKLYGHWLRTYAVIVDSVDEYAYDNGVFGENSTIAIDSNNSTNTNTTSDDGVVDTSSNTGSTRIKTYCAQVNYTTAWNAPVTAISDYPSDCSTSPDGISIGLAFEIRYNPDNPQDFIKQVFFADEIMSLGLMIGIGFVLTLILCYFICKSKPEDLQQHDSFDGYGGGGGGDDEEMGRPRESPEERKERILSKMIFQTVREDLSNITAERMRELATEELAAEETTNPEEQQQEDQATIDNDPKEKPTSIPKSDTTTGEESHGALEERKDSGASKKGEAENQNDDRSTVGSSATSIEHDGNNHDDENHQGNGSLLQMFTSYWRPEGEGEAECCVCLDKYEAGDTICASKNQECTHVYHKDCVMDWLKNHNQCPLCRTDLLR